MEDRYGAAVLADMQRRQRTRHAARRARRIENACVALLLLAIGVVLGLAAIPAWDHEYRDVDARIREAR